MPQLTLAHYWTQIEEGVFVANNPVELYLSRIAAFSHLADVNPQKAARARQYLLTTMTITEEDYDFPSKIKFVSTVTHWEEPRILCSRNDDNLKAVVYETDYIAAGKQGTLHEISFFTLDHEGKYTYTHKFLLGQLCADIRAKESTQSTSTIRTIGDPILHRPAQIITDFSARCQQFIRKQMDVLKEFLHATGGVGIAANQCRKLTPPLSIILTGVDYRNAEHVARAHMRYPTTLFPRLQYFLNPEIESVSPETEVFAEGCLSVPGALRALVARPKSVTISYQDITGAKFNQTFTGSDARVMLHELDHINYGKVYFQRIIEELSSEQLKALVKKIQETLVSSPPLKSSSYSAPVLIFNRDMHGAIIFSLLEAERLLQQTPANILIGMLKFLQIALEAQNITNATSFKERSNRRVITDEPKAITKRLLTLGGKSKL